MPRPKVAHLQSHTRDIADSLRRERPDLDPADYLYLLYVERLGRIVDTLDERHCRSKFGVSASDMRVLYALRRAGPSYAMRPTELFRSLLVTSGAITKQVDRLAEEGCVVRKPGPEKSGGYLIQLTAKGKKLADKALTSLVDPVHWPVERLTRQERKTLCMLLEKMLFDLEERLNPADSATRS